MNQARSPDEIERDITDIRERISDTLDAVQDRLSPGQVLDQLLTYSKDGGNALVDACARAVTRNPLPATLLGFSLAWLLYSNSRPEPEPLALADEAREKVREQARAGIDWTRDQAERARDAGESYIKSNPLTAAAIAIGVGALIGALLPPQGHANGRAARSRRRR